MFSCATCMLILPCLFLFLFFFFFKQKTAYEMRISDWSSDVCSSDLCHVSPPARPFPHGAGIRPAVPAAACRRAGARPRRDARTCPTPRKRRAGRAFSPPGPARRARPGWPAGGTPRRDEEAGSCGGGGEGGVQCSDGSMDIKQPTQPT